MLELRRTVRFCLAHDGSLAADAPRDNTFAAWPPMRGLGSYYEISIACRGEPDPATGFFMNIKRIDHAVRSAALPLVARAAHSPALGALVRDVIATLNPLLDSSVVSVELHLTPTYSLTVEASDMSHTLITQRYEFSAAHRLHSDKLSDAENRTVFGKCNNPAGHGHNYTLEVAVRAAIDAEGGTTPVERLDAIVDAAVIEKLDHKHLDRDVPQFKGLNSTVENIARVIYADLKAALRGTGLALDHVRVWETGKTVCTYKE